MRRMAVLLLGGLAGCAATDPLLNQEAWRPSGANEANILAQLANPADAFHGREPMGGSDGQAAAVAVLRVRIDRVKALPDSSLTDLKVQGSGSAAAAAGGP